MKLTVKDFCIRCGLCEDLHGELFHFNHKKDAIDIKYEEIPSELEEKAKKAMGDCAIAAIHIAK